MNRGGFTLLEVMVAILVTSAIALLSYGTARAGIDTEERLERHRSQQQSALRMRAFLVDALRHPAEEGGANLGEVLFALSDQQAGDGVPADQLQFLSRGVGSPRGTSGHWLVTVTTGENAVRLAAQPVSDAGAAPIALEWRGPVGLNVRVISRAGDSAWATEWNEPGRVPAAVALEFWTGRAAPAGAPLVVRTGLRR